MNNKISIIIPVYNLESYIEKTVKSVLQQTYSNIEVIIVDDGSTDESWEKIKNIEKTDKRVIAIHQKNNGVTSARLNGIKYSTGQWIGFVDGDDEIETDMYQVLIDMAVRWKADISHCGYQMVFEDGRIHYFHNTGNIIQQDKVKGIRDLLEGEIIEPGLCNKLFKKSLFRDLFDKNVIPTDIKINEDLLMNYYLFMHSNKAVFIDVCKYHYLVRSTSATRKGLNHSRIYDPITVKKIILNDVSEELKKCALKSYLSTCINVYNVLMLEKNSCFTQEEHEVRKTIVSEKSCVSFLSKKQQLLAKIILYAPGCYRWIYRCYAKYFLKNKYE